MNPLTHEAARNANEIAFTGVVSGITTAVFVLMFLGWTFWALRPANRGLMEDLGKLPLQDDTDGGAA